jgi:mevalonate pyrophosphate decarboxylase
MDAGPQVKIFCLEAELDRVLEALRGLRGDWKVLVSRPGPDPVCEVDAPAAHRVE